jgi:metal-responsive CopG/Arc/MetJ family transcriptional regulator
MEAISLKLDKNMLHNIDNSLGQNNYSTRTEFIRDAIRDKLNHVKRKELAEEFLKYQGKSKKTTTNHQNKKTAEKALNELAEEMGWKY